MASLLQRWNSLSLALQFLLVGGIVSLTALVLVGMLVTRVIETSVTRNSAASTALYVDSVIAPLLPDMQKTQVLDETVTHALDETLDQGALGQRLMSFRLWRRDGTILYSSDKRLTGKKFDPNPNLKAAFSGKFVAEFDQLDDPESGAERSSGQPLLEIYNPVLQPWSGEVVAVSEFYEIATDFERTLHQARLVSWLAVTFLILSFFLILSAIVIRGSRTIDSQSRALEERVRELSQLLHQNRSLRLRVQHASQQTMALNENYLRRIGADLHDGPAQLIALSALKLDSPSLLKLNADPRYRQELSAIKSALDDAMREIRNICNGLALPHIEAADLPEILARAARAHEQHTHTAVEMVLGKMPPSLSASQKICIYRFVQEALSNAYRHGRGSGQSLRQSFEHGSLVIEVADSGPGFDQAAVDPGSLGLIGLRERVESIGGRFAVETSRAGTRVRMELNREAMEDA